MIENLIRPELRSFIPYNANQQPYKIKLDANESPFELPDAARKKFSEFILNGAQLNLYPDTNATALRKAIAGHWNVDEDMVIVGTGSDQLIQVIANVFVGREDRVLYPVPSFGMYRDSCIIAGGIPAKYALDPEEAYRYSREKILREYEEQKPKLIYICNPNNPTGNLMSAEDILYVADRCHDVIVVVDEAYAEFCDVTVIPQVKEFENLLVLRTFSKAYGLAGVRCGYSIASKKLTQLVNLARPPYNISSLSQYAAQLVLEEKEQIQKNIFCLIEQRNRLFKELAEIDGVKVYDSSANFILVKSKNCSEVYRRLCEKGILVRAFANAPLLSDCMRISVGTHEQNTVLLDEIRAICYNNVSEH